MLIGLSVIVGLLMILLTATNPLGTTIGFVLSSIAITVVVLCYLWVDRWEPEPPRLLILAFLWSAGVPVGCVGRDHPVAGPGTVGRHVLLPTPRAADGL